MRNKLAIAVIALMLCALSTLYYVQVDTLTQNASNLESGPSLRKSEDEEDEVVDVNLQPCECSRRLTRLTPIGSVSLSETTCSQAAFARGGNQKVVSFSYYEKNEKLSVKRQKTGKIKDNVFLKGLQINIDLLPRFYPGQL